jgi:hypothetical protein
MVSSLGRIVPLLLLSSQPPPTQRPRIIPLKLLLPIQVSSKPTTRSFA